MVETANYGSKASVEQSNGGPIPSGTLRDWPFGENGDDWKFVVRLIKDLAHGFMHSNNAKGNVWHYPGNIYDSSDTVSSPPSGDFIGGPANRYSWGDCHSFDDTLFKQLINSFPGMDFKFHAYAVLPRL